MPKGRELTVDALGNVCRKRGKDCLVGWQLCQTMLTAELSNMPRCVETVNDEIELPQAFPNGDEFSCSLHMKRRWHASSWTSVSRAGSRWAKIVAKWYLCDKLSAPMSSCRSATNPGAGPLNREELPDIRTYFLYFNKTGKILAPKVS